MRILILRRYSCFTEFKSIMCRCVYGMSQKIITSNNSLYSISKDVVSYDQKLLFMSHVYITVCFYIHSSLKSDNEFQSTTISCLNLRANLNLNGSLFFVTPCRSAVFVIAFNVRGNTFQKGITALVCQNKTQDLQWIQTLSLTRYFCAL